MTGAGTLVVCARLDEREWWDTLSVRGEVAERGFELGRMQKSRYEDTSLSSRSLLLRSKSVRAEEKTCLIEAVTFVDELCLTRSTCSQ